LAPSFEDLRVRLIQIRLEPHVEHEEQETFLKRTLLRRDQLLVTNAIRDPLTPDVAEGVDAILIGGAGAFSVTRTYMWTQDLIDLVHHIYDRGTPLFGCCWGHQFIARAFGGEVVNDLDRSEMGCGAVQLTDAGLSDPLFSFFPKTFKANMGHQDRVAVLPDNAVELASNDVAPYQAIRIEDKPIYGTQFHSELDAEAEHSRIIEYRHHYPLLTDEENFQRVVASLEPTTEVDTLLNRFLQTFAVRGTA